MNADFFKFENHSNTCPACHRVQSLPLEPEPSKRGLYRCPYCHQRLVVSHSGHYVRDPFRFRPLKSSQLLRRQSHPLARACRDLTTAKAPSWVTLMASIALLSFALAAAERLKLLDRPIPEWIENKTQLMGL
ncbi:hypothetical protein [Roseofilum casamattae]|uniref:InsA N-terminal domain-containing protein n=1 Tax=Roseofilum casamattae BLCC-M143 TaxID=3022442 RepID=A0ABT7BV33_9CYAN|nr:hypothetical protein [Roseofilum casamattae]MDJ1183054.1 hypothetical protein [Roseofilum casamattae BLCC-M143]